MKISIIVPDKIVVIDGVARKLSFALDTVHAIQMDTEKGKGEVEFELVDPDGEGPLPPIKPANEMIDTATFTERYQHIVDLWNEWMPPPSSKISAQPNSAGSSLSSQPQEAGAITSESDVTALQARVKRLEDIIAALGGGAKALTGVGG